MADEKKELTMEQLDGLVTGIVERVVTAKGLVPLGTLKETVANELKSVVTNDIRPAFEESLKKLSRLPGPGGSADIGKDADGALKGLEKTGGFDSISEFGQHIAFAYRQGGTPSAKLLKWKNDVKLFRDVVKAAGTPTLEIGDPEAGGELVPPEYAMTLLEKGLDNSDFMSFATKVPMARNLVRMPYLKDFDRSGGYVFGAMNSYWTDELGTKVASNPQFGHIELKLHKLVLLMYSSDELLDDSAVSLEPLFNVKAPQALGWRLDKAMLTGTGGATPVGVLSSANPALIAVTKESGQAADTITFANIISMYSRMRPAQLKDAVWIANPGCFPQLASMYISVGVAGAPVWLPANGVSGQPFDTLMGKRIIWSEHAPALGDKGDISLVSWPEYMVGMKSGAGSGIKFASSIHLMFLYDQSAFRWVYRVDGQPSWPSVFTPAAGPTLSPFVCIEERA